MSRRPADLRISFKKRGGRTHRIELIRQPFGLVQVSRSGDRPRAGSSDAERTFRARERVFARLRRHRIAWGQILPRRDSLFFAFLGGRGFQRVERFASCFESFGQFGVGIPDLASEPFVGFFHFGQGTVDASQFAFD